MVRIGFAGDFAMSLLAGLVRREIGAGHQKACRLSRLLLSSSAIMDIVLITGAAGFLGSHPGVHWTEEGRRKVGRAA